ncbi:hypothetical protein [Pedobacter agri]|uniref:hypothetical protein n=1 Tax=Pedobacter agri TaxID=454586 RepID=UPI0027892226|nr:hypothetical protein [Pedobacter agri]MDQ1141801.1 phosphatidylglycerophosphatase A [Pedobacter agri]
MTTIPTPSDDKRFFEILDLCCKKIEEKMGTKPIADWRSPDYNLLNSQLGRQTKVYLSENTLKRIFGRLKTPTRYYPQKATRDALAQFIGYRDWQEFELINRFAPQVAPAIQQEIKVADVEHAAPDEKLSKVRTSKLIIGVAIFILAIVVGGFIVFNEIDQVKPGEVSLICENPNGEVPHTAVFKLSRLGNVNEDKQFTINFMDEGPLKTITANQEVVQFFKNPGVVHVRLFYKNKAIDTIAVSMQTKGWVANSGHDSLSAFPIARLQPLSKQKLFVSAKQLDSAGINLSKPFMIGFSKIHTSNISGDNFLFKCQLKTEESRPGIACMQASIFILGSEGRHRVLMVKPSCSAFSEYNFSELHVNGTSKNLSNMSYDFSAGGNVKLLVKNKKVSLFINDKNLLNTTYNKSIGKVLGVKILFNGIGTAASPELSDLNTGESY